MLRVLGVLGVLKVRQDMRDGEGLTTIPSPAVLPPFAARHTVRLGPDAADEGPALPAELREAIASRRREFLAGRYCAARALAALLGGATVPIVDREAEGVPAWPVGVVGAITHTGELASAAVARASEARGVGIDTERLDRFLKPPGISRLVVLPEEDALDLGSLPAHLRLPIVFSAKEAIFKCLYPLVRRRFYFKDAALTEVDAAGTFVARLTTTLAPGLGPDLAMPGRFVFDEAYVHTGTWLPSGDNLIL